jgi:hypothetical protein
LGISPDWNDSCFITIITIGPWWKPKWQFFWFRHPQAFLPTAITTWIVWPRQCQRPDAYFPHSQNLPLVDSLTTTPTEPHIDTHRNFKPPVLFGFWGKILLAFLGFTSVLQGILEVKLAWFVLSSCAF